MYLNNCTFIFKESYRSISVDVCFCLPVMESCGLGRKMEQLWKEDFFSFALHYSGRLEQVGGTEFLTRLIGAHSDSGMCVLFAPASILFICIHSVAFTHLPIYCTLWLCSPWSLSPVKSGGIEDVYSHSLIRDCFLKASIVILNKLVFCHSCCNLWRKYWFESIENY